MDICFTANGNLRICLNGLNNHITPSGSRYRTYELIFKLLPILPDRLAKDVNVRQFLWVPTILQTSIAFVVDLILGIKNINPDFFAYQRYYTFHMGNFFGRLVGLEYRKATRIKDDWPHDDSQTVMEKPGRPARVAPA